MAWIQPAKKGYFFKQGYIDIWSVITQTFDYMREGIKDHFSRISGSKIFGKIYHLFVIAALAVIGFMISIAISLMHVVVIFIIMLIYYMIFTVVLIIDRTFLSVKKVSISCRECKAKYMYPIYVCPVCGERHDHLTPSVYGAFLRTCNCGNKLPSSVFSVKGKKRSDLYAFCPDCAKENRQTALMDRASRPVCIPVVGGPSVGKSTFITAYVNRFISYIADGKGVEVEFYDHDVYNDYLTKMGYYGSGQITKTAVQTDQTRASSIAFSFFVKHKSLGTDRLVHIYDIAGESFLNGPNETQKQYDYCNGIILVLDPFAIPDVMSIFGAQLSQEDKSGTSSASISEMMGDFMNTLENTTKLPRSRIKNIPLAVVISKRDEADLDLFIGDAAVKRTMSNHPDIFADEFDTMDYLCREFLAKTDMNDVLEHVKQNFKNARFFSISAIGHSLNGGQYIPQNVVPVIDWIYKNSDAKLESLVSTTVFSGKIMPIESSIETVDLDDVEAVRNSTV